MTTYTVVFNRWNDWTYFPDGQIPDANWEVWAIGLTWEQACDAIAKAI